MTKVKHTTVEVLGMHCPSCDILVHDAFNECAGVTAVRADHKSQTAFITHDKPLTLEQLNAKVHQYGYEVQFSSDHAAGQAVPYWKRAGNAGAIAVILFIIYYFASEFHLIPTFAASTLSLPMVFLLGLIASTSTCMATSGALYLATIGKSSHKPLLQSVMFNLGRIVSYSLFGFAAGLVGQVFVQNVQLSTLFTAVIATLMLAIGLDMAGLLPFSSVSALSIGKRLYEPIRKRLLQYPKRTAFLLGASTYLLPCGFTQTVQLYALGLADPLQSAVIMMVFAIGTMPALLAIGYAVSWTKKRWYPVIAQAMGVVIVLIGIGYLFNVLYLWGVRFPDIPFLQASQKVVDQNVLIRDGVQVASMSVDAGGYHPMSFTVKRGVPVRWEINGENVFGCQGVLVAPKINVQKTLEKGKNVITFTPTEVGQIDFSCAMGMYRGSFNVVEG